MSTETKCDICSEQPATFKLHYSFGCGQPECCWDIRYLCDTCLDTQKHRFLGYKVEHIASGESYSMPERMLI